MWQLRTVRLNGQHFVAPFIINGGGISATQPILGMPLVKRIAADHSNPNKTLCVETPIGDLVTLSEWDAERNGDVMQMGLSSISSGMGWPNCYMAFIGTPI